MFIPLLDFLTWLLLELPVATVDYRFFAFGYASREMFQFRREHIVAVDGAFRMKVLPRAGIAGV